MILTTKTNLKKILLTHKQKIKKIVFLTSTKLPTLEPLDRKDPDLILEKGPAFTLDSKVAFSICVNDKISTFLIF